MENHHLNIIVLFKWGWLPLLSNYQRWFRWVRSFPWAHGPRDKRQQVWQRPRLLASLLFLSLALAAKHVADRSSVDPSEWGISLQPYGYNQLASKIQNHWLNAAFSNNPCILQCKNSLNDSTRLCDQNDTIRNNVSNINASVLSAIVIPKKYLVLLCSVEVPKMEDPQKKTFEFLVAILMGFPKCVWGNPKN